jgi:Hemerythrin HHE cation binding domain
MSASCRRLDDDVVTDRRKPTMPQPTAPLVTTDSIDAAALVRRALLASAGELVEALAEAAASRRHKDLDRWFAGFADQLRRQHDLFDSMVMPALAARGALDQRSLDTIAGDHAWIDQLISDLGDALGILSFGLGAEAWWTGKAADLAAVLDHVLRGQLSREERLLTPLIARWFTPAERDVVQREAMRAVASGRTPFSLGWLFTHLDEAERAAVTDHLPATSRLSWRARRKVSARAAVAVR